MSNGLEVLDTFATRRFDVATLDVQMLDMNDLSCARRLCAKCAESLRPWLIAMTSKALEGDQEICRADDMDDYIGKPVGGPTIAATLTRAAERLACAVQFNTSPIEGYAHT